MHRTGMCFVGAMVTTKKIALTLYHFSDGDELLRAHQKHCMDLIILDIIMPLLSGLDTAKELRNKDDHTPIIFFNLIERICG